MVDKMELLVTEIRGIEKVAEAHHHAVCVRVCVLGGSVKIKSSEGTVVSIQCSHSAYDISLKLNKILSYSYLPSSAMANVSSTS
jgi:hypothetical protein